MAASPQSLRRKLLTAGFLLTTAPLLVVAAVVYQQNRRTTSATEQISIGLTHENLRNVVRSVHALTESHQKVAEQRTRHAIKVAQRLIEETGTPNLREPSQSRKARNQLTGEVTRINLPTLALGDTLLHPSSDPSAKVPIVDTVRSLLGVTCTIFQRMNGTGDMLRVATNVFDSNGARAIGTYVPRHGPDGRPTPVINTVMRDKTFVGPAFVVNEWYISAYHPLYDKSGKLIGMVYVGVPQRGLVDLRRAILNIAIGKSGYVFVLDRHGRYVISKAAARDGEDIANRKDSLGAGIRGLIGKAITLREGQVAQHTYLWTNDPTRTARQKVSFLMHFRPWGWIIGAGTYLDEMMEAPQRVADIGARSGWVLLSVLLVALAVTLLTWLAIAGDIAKPITNANEKLSQTVAALQDRTTEILTLNQLGDLLQACDTEQETYGVVARACERLFASDVGFLALLDSAQQTLRVVERWGDPAPTHTEFPQHACWAMRRGKTHIVANLELDTQCDHVSADGRAHYVCAPMSAQGQVLGTLFVRLGTSHSDGSSPSTPTSELATHRASQMNSILERYAPCLTNIRLRETLRVQSVHDPLTGLYNRRHMEEFLAREGSRAERHKTTVGVVMIDLDHFKSFNDQYGHEAGDIALRELGSYLRSAARGEDIACRYGGEEFALIMPGIDLESALRRAEEIRSGIEGDLRANYQGHPLRMTASLGVAIYPHHGSSVQQTLHAADVALYRAKQHGRNCVVVADV